MKYESLSICAQLFRAGSLSDLHCSNENIQLSLGNAFPARGFIRRLQDQTAMSNSPKRFPLYSVLWLFWAAPSCCSLINVAFDKCFSIMRLS